VSTAPITIAQLKASLTAAAVGYFESEEGPVTTAS